MHQEAQTAILPGLAAILNIWVHPARDPSLALGQKERQQAAEPAVLEPQLLPVVQAPKLAQGRLELPQKAALPLGVQLQVVQREAPQAAPQPVLPQDPQLARPELPPVRWLAHCSSRFSNLLGWLSPLWQSF